LEASEFQMGEYLTTSKGRLFQNLYYVHHHKATCWRRCSKYSSGCVRGQWAGWVGWGYVHWLDTS